jgi:hypothetical protein
MGMGILAVAYPPCPVPPLLKAAEKDEDVDVDMESVDVDVDADVEVEALGVVGESKCFLAFGVSCDAGDEYGYGHGYGDGYGYGLVDRGEGESDMGTIKDNATGGVRRAA